MNSQESQTVKAIRARYLMDTKAQATPEVAANTAAGDTQLFKQSKQPSYLLEQELDNMRNEITQLRATVTKLKSDEQQQRAKRADAAESDRIRSIQQSRDDLMRDVNDLARCNRLLSSENDTLNERYANLLRAHNRNLYGEDSDRVSPAQKLADTYKEEIKRSQTNLPKNANKSSTTAVAADPAIASLNAQTQSNQKLINEAYTAFKGRLLTIQTSNANPKAATNSENQQLNSHIAFLQETFERVYRLSDSQAGLNAKIISDLIAKNTETQTQLENVQASNEQAQQQLQQFIKNKQQSQSSQQQISTYQQQSQQETPFGAAYTFSPSNNNNNKNQDSPFFAGASNAAAAAAITSGQMRKSKSSLGQTQNAAAAAPQIRVSPPSVVVGTPSFVDRNPEQEEEYQYEEEFDNNEGDNNFLQVDRSTGQKPQKKKKKTSTKPAEGQSARSGTGNMNRSTNKPKPTSSTSKLDVSGISKKSAASAKKGGSVNKQPSLLSIDRVNENRSVNTSQNNSMMKGSTNSKQLVQSQRSLQPKLTTSSSN